MASYNPERYVMESAQLRIQPSSIEAPASCMTSPSRNSNSFVSDVHWSRDFLFRRQTKEKADELGGSTLTVSHVNLSDLSGRDYICHFFSLYHLHAFI